MIRTTLTLTLALLMLSACRHTATAEHANIADGFLATQSSSLQRTGGVTIARGYVYDANRNGVIDDVDYRPNVLAAATGETINAFSTLEAAGMRPQEMMALLGVSDATEAITPDNLSRYGAHLDAISVINALSMTEARSADDTFALLQANVARGRALIARGLATDWENVIIQISGSDLNRITSAQKNDFTELLDLLESYAAEKYSSASSEASSISAAVSSIASASSLFSSSEAVSSSSSSVLSVDCVGSFEVQGDWGECSETCGGGEQNRTLIYVISIEAENGGAACPYEADFLSQESRSCNETACAVDCVGRYDEWSDWTACSTFCNGGEQSRTRIFTITQAALNGGADCTFPDGHEDTETQDCNTHSCSGTNPLPVTGQTVSYADYDDGWYRSGVARSFSRADAIVTDYATGLMWQDDDDAGSLQQTWTEATDYCTANSLGGYTDWRLPSIEELILITDSEQTVPGMDPVFENAQTGRYWSASIYEANASNAWIVGFYNGNDFWYDVTDVCYFRCVRDVE